MRSLLAALGLALLFPTLGAAEVRRMEAVGAVPVSGDGAAGAPRDAALQAAVRDAVWRIALEMIPVEERPEAAPGSAPRAWLSDALGSDPYDYATRFRILEDRGVRRALLVRGADREYVVVVEVHVDDARVRERLLSRGFALAGEDASDRVRVRVEAEVGSYAAYEAMRTTLLEQRGVHAALPVELERGRVVLEVEADRDAESLVAGLVDRAPPELRVDPLEVYDDRVRVRVEWVEVPANVADPGPPR